MLRRRLQSVLLIYNLDYNLLQLLQLLQKMLINIHSHTIVKEAIQLDLNNNVLVLMIVFAARLDNGLDDCGL